MKSVVCTLFEGHYHYGVAALTNSLLKQGFKGSIYAGYRGSLPEWASEAVENSVMLGSGGTTYKVSKDLTLHFIPLTTDYHLTNYKPDFMLHLLKGPVKDATSLFYFDPDIIVIAPWSYFESWIKCGIALSEDVNSPVSEFHPRRVAWRTYFGSNNVLLKYKSPIYVNGGFVGVSIENQEFLSVWKQLQELMAPEIGGLNRSSFKSGQPLPESANGPLAPFGKTDQDALNATIEAWDQPVSFMGKEGMAFKSGQALMPHALGPQKPWLRENLVEALKGNKPRAVDLSYWNSAKGTIIAHSLLKIKLSIFSIKIASFIGRFYGRNSF